MADSVEEAIKAARITESTLQYINISKALRDTSQPTKKSFTVQQETSAIDSLKKEIAELKAALLVSKEEAKTPKPNDYICFACGSTGYFIKDCSLGRQDIRNNQSWNRNGPPNRWNNGSQNHWNNSSQNRWNNRPNYPINNNNRNEKPPPRNTS